MSLVVGDLKIWVCSKCAALFALSWVCGPVKPEFGSGEGWGMEWGLFGGFRAFSAFGGVSLGLGYPAKPFSFPANEL